MPKILGAAMIKVALSLPPSVNSLYANVGRKRVKTAKARRWHDTAAWQIKLAAGRIRIEGPWAIGVVLPRSMRGDCDNRLKPILDAAVGAAASSMTATAWASPSHAQARRPTPPSSPSRRQHD